jgi:hypothetical protein
VVYVVKIRSRITEMRLANGWRHHYFLVESFPQSIDIKFYHWVNNGGRYADGFYNSMIYGKDSHTPSALIMFACTVLHHAFLEWKNNKGVYPKASKSRPKAGRPDRSNHFKHKI